MRCDKLMDAPFKAIPLLLHLAIRLGERNLRLLFRIPDDPGGLALRPLQDRLPLLFRLIHSGFQLRCCRLKGQQILIRRCLRCLKDAV